MVGRVGALGHIFGWYAVATELDQTKKFGLKSAQNGRLTGGELVANRDAYSTAIRAFHAEGKMARTWPLRYLIRHTAYHTMDCAWEMEDRDMTAE